MISSKNTLANHINDILIDLQQDQKVKKGLKNQLKDKNPVL
jgi:hypothetical protein